MATFDHERAHMAARKPGFRPPCALAIVARCITKPRCASSNAHASRSDRSAVGEMLTVHVTHRAAKN